MKVRTAKPEDAENILKWGQRDEEVNLFDPDVLLYPTTDVLCAENGKPVAYIPVQLVGMLESIILNPEATTRERGIAIYKIVDGIAEQAAKQGIRELYFVCANDSVNDYAGRMGFEKMPWQVMRLRLSEKTP